MVWVKLIGSAEKRLKLNTSPRKYVDKQNFIESPGLRHRVKGPSAINNICTNLSIRFLVKVPPVEDQMRWASRSLAVRGFGGGRSWLWPDG
jgi:hypothetical protein